MDEATLVAELLAEKFNTQAQTPHLQHLQQTQQPHSQILTAATTTTAASYSDVAYPQATDTNVAATSHGELSSEPVQAYAKLEGESFCYYIRTLQVTFGRKASSSDQVDIHLGPTKAISRQHARLFYNFTTQRFEMMVFGKNGAFVNDQFVEKGVTVPLENRTKIQIGEVSFSFLLPKIEPDDTTQDATYEQGIPQRNSGNFSIDGGDARSAATSATKEALGTPTEQFDVSEYSSKDTKPPFSYASLIAQAINSTPSRKLTLNGIYQHITNNYPYYQLAQNGWQNSIRHNLSLNKAFVKVPRSDSEPGKGAFWTIDQSCENQFANGVYKRNRRAMSSKPNTGVRNRSDSESPMDQADRPRKRVNTGLEGDSHQSQQQSQALTTQQIPSPQTSNPVVGVSPMNLANPLQEAPGLSALNLAALTQTITAAAKEGNQAALASALIAAANASGIPGGLAASLPATARALAAHVQQQQLLLQQQQQAQAQARAQAQAQVSAQSQQTTIISAASSPQTLVSSAVSAQLLSNLQAVATATTAARPAASSSAASSASATASTAPSSPTSFIPISAASVAGTLSLSEPSSLLSALPSAAASSSPSNATSTPTITSSSAAGDTSTAHSPIAQLVAAAQAQARAQALAQQQQQQLQQQEEGQVQTSSGLKSPVVSHEAASNPLQATAADAVVPTSSSPATVRPSRTSTASQSDFETANGISATTDITDS